MISEKIRTTLEIPHEIEGIVRNDPFIKTLSNINSIRPVSGGVAHNVYKIDSRDSSYYLKIRGDHFVTIPTIACNPNDIEHEHRALIMLGGVVPNLVPQVHSYNPDEHYLVVSDVIGKGKKLETLFEERHIQKQIFEKYGQTLGVIHNATQNISEPVRVNGDKEYFQKVLMHRFGYRNNSTLNLLIQELSALRNRRLILGDAAPKNIGVPHKDGLLTFFDLETAHAGNAEFDFGYAIAHVVLHTLTNKKLMLKSIEEFVEGYGNSNFDPNLVEKIVKGILLYRLGSIIPYPIKLTVEKKKKAEAIILNDLEKVNGPESWFKYFE